MKKPILMDGRWFCGNCGFGYPVTKVTCGAIYSDVRSLIKSLSDRNEEDKGSDDSSDNKLKEFEKTIKEQESRLNELKQKLQRVIQEKDDLQIKCSVLEKEVCAKEQKLQNSTEDHRSQIERLVSDLESSKSESESFKEQMKILEGRNKDLEQFIQDLKETNNHSQMELAKMKTLDVRGIVTSVLEYAASVNNSVLDGSDAGAIKETIEARTEKLIMDLSRHGIKVRRHNRGDGLGDERLEIVERKTDQPELDMTVARSLNYGASFRDDLLAMIPEVVSVYRFRNKPSDDVE